MKVLEHKVYHEELVGISPELGELGWSDCEVIVQRPYGSLLSNTEVNPQEHLKAITVKSGKEVKIRNEMVMEKEKELVVEALKEL